MIACFHPHVDASLRCTRCGERFEACELHGIYVPKGLAGCPRCKGAR